MTVLTAAKAIVAIQQHVESIANNETQRFPEAASPGDAWVQGDVYITLLCNLPEGCKRVESPSLQLAPGTTQGSRHCLDGLDGVEVFSLPQPGMLDGPVLQCRKERTIEHPEHGWVVLPPGIYGISYQQSMDELERAKRVLD